MLMNKLLLTVASHPQDKTLLHPAVLAPVPLALVHLTVLVPPTQVSILLPDGPLEEPLAALATHGPIVAPCQEM